jgi:Flp pilus assembly protein TadD
MHPPHLHLSRFRFAALALGLLLGAAVSAAAPAEGARQLSEKTSEELAKVRTLSDGRDWNGALAVVEAQLALVDTSGYDAATLLQVKSQLLLQDNRYSAAIAPLERVLELSEQHGYHDAAARGQMLFYLAQLYYQEGANAKDAAVISGFFAKSDRSMQRWLELTPKPGLDALLFYSSLLYNQALTGRERADPATIGRALQHAEAALLLSGPPHETLYQLKLACLQQLGRHAESAEVLELLVTLKPANGPYWQQLAAAYVAASGEAAPAEAHTANVRAILTFERAQARGFMTTPKDNFNLVGIYFNVQQYGKAIELLERGLRSGTIDPEQKNWELLAYSYQQVKQETKAVEIFREAAALFPTSAQLEYLTAQACYALDRPAEAYTHAQRCLEKGGTDRPHVAHLFLAYLALELKHYDVALAAAVRASQFPEGLTEALKMKKVIEDLMTERTGAKRTS